MRADRGGAHDAAVEHARQPDVLDVRVNPRHLSGHLYARRRSAHHGVVGGTLRRRGTDRALKAPAPDQVSVRHAPGGVAVYTDRAVFHRELVRGHAERRGGQLEECQARLGRRLTQLWPAPIDRLAANGIALVGRAGSVALHDGDARDRHVELLGDDLGERGLHAGAQLDLAGEEGHATVLAQRQPGVNGGVERPLL